MARMPAAGYGTYKLGGDRTEACVLAALRAGYRLVDTAQVYKNERASPWSSGQRIRLFR